MKNLLCTLSLAFIASLSLNACSSSNGGGSSGAGTDSNASPEPKPNQEEVSLIYQPNVTLDEIRANTKKFVNSGKGDMNIDFSKEKIDPTTSLLAQLEKNNGNAQFLQEFQITRQGGSEKDFAKGEQFIYKQDQSAIIFESFEKVSGSFERQVAAETIALSGIIGQATTQLPAIEQTVTYTGKAFEFAGQGQLSYDVNFKEQTGSGSLYSFINGTPDLTLHTLKLSNQASFDEFSGVGGTGGQVSLSGPNNNGPIKGLEYGVLFFGDAAQELVGRVQSSTSDLDWIKEDAEIIFAGQRQ